MPTPLRVLILEDRASDAELMAAELRRAGYDPAWQRVDGEADYLTHLAPGLDLILADYSLPQFTGLRALRLLRERGLEIPFILVTGELGDERAVECVRQGADDYVLKDRMARLGPAVAQALASKQLREDRRRAEEALRANAEEKAVINEVARIVTTTLEIDQAYEKFAAEVKKLLDFDRMTINIIDHDAGTFTPAYRAGLAWEGHEIGAVLPLGGSMTERALRTGRPHLREDIQTSGGFSGDQARLQAGLRSSALAPLLAKGRVIGALTVSSTRTGAYGPKEQAILERLAGQIAPAVENARLHQELRESEQRFRSIFRSAPVGMDIVNAEGRTILTNPALEEMLGYTGDELLRMPFGAYTHDEDLEKSLSLFKEMTEGKRDLGFLEKRYIRKNGEAVWARLSISAVRDDEGRFQYTTSCIEDITERRRAQEALRESEAAARRLADENTVLAAIGRIISSSLDIDEVYEPFAGMVRGLVEFERMTINLVDPEQGTYTRAFVVGTCVESRERGDVKPLSGSMTEQVMLKRSGILCNAEEEHDFVRRYPSLEAHFRAGLRSFISVPVLARDEVVGVLHLRSAKRNAYSQRELRLAERVGDQIGGAISNSQLYAELALAEQAMEESEERYRDLYEEAPIAYLSVSPDGRILRANRRAHELFGYAEGELTGRPALDLYADGTHGKVKARGLAKRLARGEGVISEELEYRTADGRQVWGSLSVHPITDTDGTVIASRSTVEDITERKRAEDRVRELNNQLEQRVAERTAELGAIQASMTEGLLVVDRNGLVRHFNQAAQDITGLDAQAVVGKSLKKMLSRLAPRLANPGDLKAVAGMLDGSVEGPVTLETVSSRAGRREFTVASFPIDENEERWGLLGFLLRDVTKERDVERRRDSFVSIASHELRTPMTSILGFSELLLRRDPPETTRLDWLRRIHGEAQRVTAIVDDLLNVSRIQSGALEVMPERLRLRDEVKRAVGVLSATTEKHELAEEVPQGVPYVWADRNKLEQVLMNLLDNAIKYSPKGGRVSVMARHEPDRKRVVVSVSDQGVGISSEDQEHLFSTFHRISRPETEGIGGTGLGLFIVKALVELMRGEVWVESELMQGSTFYFSLPTSAPRES